LKPDTLTAREVAKRLGLSLSSTYVALAAGKSIPCLTVGKRRLIPRAAFEKWLESVGKTAI
jgi:excisionase family DNA binding protein